jgi:tetratricopeptide (TPR) repeat protein
MATNPNLPMGENPQVPQNVPPPLLGGNETPEPPQEKRKGKWWILLVLWTLLALVILAVLIFNPISRMFYGISLEKRQIKADEAKLQQPDIFEPVARRLATYCQSDQSLFPKILSYAWLPGKIQHLEEPWCEVTPKSARVEFGGGFYHYGYNLELDQAKSFPATNVWNLFLAREGQDDKLLTTLALAVTQQVTAADLQKLLGASFDQLIKDNQPDSYRGKVMSQLRFGQTAQAAATCEDWMKAKPDSWLARLAYAHIRCRMGETEPAAAGFSEWVNANKNFSLCIYLALFNYREGRTNQAVEAVRLALDQPFVESPGTGGNKFYLGQNGALIAYAGGDSDLCVLLCDKMLADSENGYSEKVWRRKILRVKAAVMFMKGNQPAAVDLMKQAENNNEPDPFSQAGRTKADQALLEAIQKKNTEYISDTRNWVDGRDTWFSPFDTDESEWHGSDLQVPTPYPTSWKTDLINTNWP